MVVGYCWIVWLYDGNGFFCFRWCRVVVCLLLIDFGYKCWFVGVGLLGVNWC